MFLLFFSCDGSGILEVRPGVQKQASAGFEIAEHARSAYGLFVPFLPIRCTAVKSVWNRRALHAGQGGTGAILGLTRRRRGIVCHLPFAVCRLPSVFCRGKKRSRDNENHRVIGRVRTSIWKAAAHCYNDAHRVCCLESR